MNKREYDYRRLRGRIKERVGTEGAFARRIGRSPNFISKVFRNETYFTHEDIVSGAEILEIEQGEIGSYFFTQQVHKNETQ